MKDYRSFSIAGLAIILALLLVNSALAQRLPISPPETLPVEVGVTTHSCFAGFLPLVFRDHQEAGPAGNTKYNRPAADYNGDGCADLAIGAPRRDANAVSDSGMVFVVYGSTRVWDDGPVVHPLFQASGGLEDQFGSALAFGDFNRDGYSDLVVGIIGKDLNGPWAGQIRVYDGSKTGLTVDDYVVFDQFQLIDFPEEQDLFSRALAAGDFNGDGYEDLAVSATGEDYQAVLDSGVIHILFGSDTGLSSTGDLRFARNDLVIGDLEVSDQFGTVLDSADFDDDGYDDLAIGTPFSDILGATNAGRVDVLYGSPGGPNLSNQVLDQEAMTGQTAQPQDRFGSALAVGDFNGDGYADLGIGAPGETHFALDDAGSAHVFYGSASGLGLDGAQTWTHTDGLVGGSVMEGFLGHSMVADDFDADGFDELAIGEPGEEDGAGSIHVLIGTPGGLTHTGSQHFTQDTPGIVGTAAVDDYFAYALASGDYDLDGFADLAVGVPFNDIVSGAGVVDAGEVNIIFGSVDGLDTPGNLRFFLDLVSFPGDSQFSDWFGLSIR